MVLGNSLAFSAENPVSFDELVFSRTDHNITHPNYPNRGQPWSSIKTEIVITKNAAGGFDLYKVTTLPDRGGKSPIGAFSKNMRCTATGESYANYSLIVCINDNSEISGRIDTATIKQQSNGSYDVQYSWSNVNVATNHGTKDVAVGLGLSKVTDKGTTISLFPGNIDYQNP